MAVDDMSVLRRCSVCRTVFGKITVKKENMMLASPKQPVFCPTCKTERRELREVEGRVDVMLHERATYPRSGLEVGLGQLPEGTPTSP